MSELVKFTNTEAQTAYAVLAGGEAPGGKVIAGQLDREDLVAPVQYRIGRLGQEVLDVVKAFEDSVRRARKSYAATDDNGNPRLRKDKDGVEVPGMYVMDPDRYDEFEAEVEALGKVVNEIRWDLLDAKLLYANKGKGSHIPGGGRVTMALAPFLDTSKLSDSPTDSATE